MFRTIGTRIFHGRTACLALGLLFCAAFLAAQGLWVRVTIQNASSFDIYKVYLSRSSDPNWRHDLLGTGVLVTGRTFDITAPVGVYDLKLVDEDSDVCVVNGVSVYQNTVWRITDSWLLGCEFH
jgi:hypothetical protein